MLYAESNGTAGLNSIYTWKNMLMGDDGGTPIGGIVHQLSFTGDKLRAKEYTNYTQPFSTCTPTEIGLNKIMIGQNWTSTQNQQAIGCDASLSYAMADINGNSVKQYSWGNLIKDTVTTQAYASVDSQGIVRSKYIRLVPPTK